MGEDFLLEKRKKLDRDNRMKKNGNGLQCGPVRSQKSGMIETEGSGRHSKKRKYVLLGDNWGKSEGNKECGLNCKLDNNASRGNMVTIDEV